MPPSFRAWLVALLLASFASAAPAQPVPGVVADFTDLFEKQGPAVVSIDVTQKVKHPSRGGGLPEGHPDVPRRGQPREAPPEILQQSEGSGFIVGSDGYVVTNAHVVEGATEVQVTLSDKREFTAKVVGADKLADVALLKIDATGLPKVTIGDPDKLRVGEWVVAIGKPFGLDNSLTAGIVSAKGRDLPDEDLVPFIQTDAAVNPGNSGGPLLNLRGEVVGITSMIYSESGGFMGISFAIPIDIAMNAVAQLREKGRVTRGRIGIEIGEVNRDTAESFGLPKPAGALVNSVEKDGPAAAAGLRAGDIIVAVDGRPVHSFTDLPRAITSIRPGTSVKLGVWRDNASREIAVTVAEAPDEDAGQKRETARREKAAPNRIGLALAELPAERRRELGVAGGVLVEDVAATVRANVRPGDVLLAIVARGRTTDATSPAQVDALLATLAPGVPVTLRLSRGGQELFASLRVPAAN